MDLHDVVFLHTVQVHTHTYVLHMHIICTYVLTFADINKFLWMVRIGGSTEKGQHIKESDYYTPQGEFRVDRDGAPILLNCLMYKMCYYRFGQVYTEHGELAGCSVLPGISRHLGPTCLLY